MILYLTSNRPSVVENGRVVAPCPATVCRARGMTFPHLCFATEPLTGLGNFVYHAEVPVAVAEKYEYDNDFRTEGTVRCFALPHEVVVTLTLTRSTYEEITGNPWNHWTITVLDRRGTTPGLLGKWAVVWQSRDGIFSARVGHKTPEKYLSVEVTATQEFDPEKDYLVVENHEEYQKESGPGIKETWRLLTQAGITPQWVIFPSLWENWVWDDSVRNSAIDYLMRNIPECRQVIEFANRMESKSNVARSWRDVSDRLNLALSRKLGRNIYLGKFGSHSWTAVRAMPMRIAERVSSNISAPWHPPRPKPVFQHPNDSGRVILANLYGAYPKHGPGVDHDPQDRPYIGEEGELKKSFSPGQDVAAPALAGDLSGT